MFSSVKQKISTFTTHKATNYVLGVLILTLAISYVCFVNVTVRTVAALEKTKEQNLSLSVKVSEMESKRLIIEDGINIEKAKNLGFVEVNNPTFIVKNSKTALSLKID